MNNTVRWDVVVDKLNQMTFVVRPRVLLVPCRHCRRRNDALHPKNKRERHDWIVGHVWRLVLKMRSV